MIKYTAGGEYIDSYGKQYIGYYIKLRGKYYAGKRYVYIKSKQLFKVDDQKTQYQYHQHANYLKPYIENQKIDYSQFQIVTYPKKELQQIYTVYILYHNIDNLIYEVKSQTYKKYKNNSNFESYEVKLKKESSIIEYGYNNKRISQVYNQKVRKYLNKIRN